MNRNLWRYDDVGEALRQVHRLAQEAKERGADLLRADVGEHLNPGDVYDAYEALKRRPITEDALEPDCCGPFEEVKFVVKSIEAVHGFSIQGTNISTAVTQGDKPAVIYWKPAKGTTLTGSGARLPQWGNRWRSYPAGA